MSISEKVMEALRAGILLNDRVATLMDKLNIIDQDVRKINDRVIRLETMVEIVKMQPKLSGESR